LFQKFHVLCVTDGVHQKYLRIVCITMNKNELMNSISVLKKTTGMSYIIKSWTDSSYNNCEIDVLFWDSKLSSWNYEQNVGQPLSRQQHIIENYVTHFCEIPSFVWRWRNSCTNNRLRYTLRSVTAFTILLLANVLFVISWRQFRIPK
jgi:hypothetical protein